MVIEWIILGCIGGYLLALAVVCGAIVMLGRR